MEPIYIRQRLRPSRYAFLVNEGDNTPALLAASLNAALWGGIYNPIVPLTPVESRDGLLKEFDPDSLINLSGADLPADVGARYEHRIIATGDLVRTDNGTKRRGLGFGFNILPIIRHVHEKEVRFAAEPTRATLLVPDPAEGWPEFVAFAYGSFQWLPEMDTNFEEAFRNGLRAKTINLSDRTPPPDYEDLVLPIDFTRYGLQSWGGSANFSSHIIYIADHQILPDLIEFWNIRATGRSVLFVPVAAYRAFEPLIRFVAAEGRYTINQQVENHADLQRGPSVTDAVFDEVCAWIGTLDLGPLTKRVRRPRFGMEIEFYVGDIHAADIQASEGEEISILENERMMPVKMISPPFLDEQGTRKGEFTWSVDVSMTGGYLRPEWMFSFPDEPAVEAVVRRAVIAMPSEVRLGHRGLVLQEDWPRSNLQLIPVRTKDVFGALFQQAGLEAEPSEPGQYAEGIIKKMGSLHGDCRVFKIRGVREILDRLGNGSTLTKGNMYQIVMSEVPDKDGQKNWRPELYSDLILRYGQRGPLDFGTIFDVLLEARIIRPGFVLECRSCSKRDWYHVSEFDEEYTCRYCFTRQRVNFASPQEWQYKADGLFQIPDSAQGSVAVIISMWRFSDLTHLNGRYVTSQNLVAKDNGHRYEIDYAFLVTGIFDTSYELVLGQAARFGDFTDDEMRRTVELADRFTRKPYLAFSTLKDRYSDAERERLGDLVSRDYKVISLTREELDPYFLFDRFKDTPRKHAASLEDLAVGTVHLNVGPPRARR